MFRHVLRPMPHVLVLAVGIGGLAPFILALWRSSGALYRAASRIVAVLGPVFGFYCQYAPILDFAFGIARKFGWS